MAIGKFLKRNLVVILFPTFTASTIYLDLAHTRKWKEQQKLEAVN